MCTIGMQQRQPSVLHMIHAVPGKYRASHSSSLLALALCGCGVVARSMNSACLVPQLGGWSCGERDSALEHYLVAGVVPLT